MGCELPRDFRSKCEVVIQRDRRMVGELHVFVDVLAARQRRRGRRRQVVVGATNNLRLSWASRQGIESTLTPILRDVPSMARPERVVRPARATAR